MLTELPKATVMLSALTFLLLLAACGGDDGGGGESAPPAAVDAPVKLEAIGPNAVSYWSDVATATSNGSAAVMTTPEEQNPVYSLDLATVHVAMYDAATAIDGRYRPYAITPAASAAGASLPAAIAAAAYGVLRRLYPDYADQYSAKYTAYVAAIPEGDAKVRGIAVGAEVAAAMIALRANDGRMTTLPPYQPGTAPGTFRGDVAVYRFAAFVKPFALASVNQFRPAGPPALTTAAYATDFAEVKSLGGTNSAARTAEQTDKALFFGEFPGTQFPRNFARLAQSTTNLADAARLLAMIWVAQADSTLACFEAKYAYFFWRPQSAVPLADTDSNPATDRDPSWAPLLSPPPPHPEYPAGHLCYGIAFAETLHQFYGTRKVTFSFDSTATNETHVYPDIDAFAQELLIARIAAGIHFRFSVVDGQTLGTRVAEWSAQHYFGKR